MTRTLRAAVIGVGLAGGPHIEAIRRTGMAQVVGVAASSADSVRRAAKRYGHGLTYQPWRELVENPTIDVVHNCTPNYLHEAVGHATLAAGKHLITEKPLAATLDEAASLVQASDNGSAVTALCHNYRHYAMVAEAHELIRAGAIGEVFHVHGVYLQDWLSDPAVRNWRLNPKEGGPSTTFADIGTHWCDLAMHLLDRRIESVCAATASRHGRATDDHGGVLFRFGGDTLGTLVTSQVSPGAKNSLRIRLDGSDGSLSWDQERPEELWLGRLGGPTELRHKSADQLHERARPRAHLPAGEIEGWNSTFVNLFGSVYRRILGCPLPGDEWVATLPEGLFLMRVIDAVGASNAERAWVDLPAANAV
ncbi:MAG: Gfo/Idh/MocA family oxidoreductase [Solirubrobacteraceae bacterium]